MSKINGFRMINVNYNNNAIRISDEAFHLNGESTLASLRNGGGKSVLVQMLMAPFVHKRYRDAKDRPFDSYFTTNKPSFILVEWVLDQGAGYVLTGMMVRRTQDVENTNGSNLEMINIISEYQQPCMQDMHHLPVVEKGKKTMVLKNFMACRQLFESYKKDSSVNFFYYDMNNSAQSRQYFDKLKEYQIDNKEWETIIRKINLEESGLSNLFADCKDERGLVDKWFLDAIESKLNKDKNRMQEFQKIVEKYVGQYKDNQSKIKRRDTIRAFKEESGQITEKAQLCQKTGDKKRHQENKIAHFIEKLSELREETSGSYQESLRQSEEVEQAISHVQYEKLSSEVHQLEDDQSFHVSNRLMIEMEQEELEQEVEKTERYLHLLLCAKQQELTKEEERDLLLLRQKLEVSRQKDEDLKPERNRLGYQLKCYYERALDENKEQGKDKKELHRQVMERIGTEKEKISKLEEEIRQKMAKEGSLQSKVESYSTQEDRYNNSYGESLTRNILGTYEPGTMEIRKKSYQKELDEETRRRLQMKKQIEGSKNDQRSLERSLSDLEREKIQKQLKKEQQEKQKDKYDRELEKRKVIMTYLEMDENSLFDTVRILKTSERKLMEIAALRRNLEKEEDTLQKEYQSLTQGKVLELPKEFETELHKMDIHVVYGMEWLKKNGYTEKENRKLVESHPFLPYALILSQREMEKLSGNPKTVFTSFPIPIMVREDLEEKPGQMQSGIVEYPDVSFYVLFNENLLNEKKLRVVVQEKEQQIQRKKEAAAIRQSEYEEYFERRESIKNQEVTKEKLEKNKEAVGELGMQLKQLDEKAKKTSSELAELKTERDRLEKEIQKSEQRIFHQKRRMEDYIQLCEAYQIYEQNRQALERCSSDISEKKENQRSSRGQLDRQTERQRDLETKIDQLEREAHDLSDKFQIYARYSRVEADLSGQDFAEMEARYGAITSSMSQELQDLEAQEQKASRRYEEALDELTHLSGKYHLNSEEWRDIRYDRKGESHREILLEDVRKKLNVKNMLWNEEDKQIAVLIQQKEDRLKRIKSECGEDHALSKAEISDQDFDARRNKLLYQKTEIQKQENSLKSRLQSYDENLTALAEYHDLPLQNEVVWEQNFSAMDSRALRTFKGILIRDYNQHIRDGQEAKERMVHVLNRIVRMDQFQDDFYKKPLESMLELSEDASSVLKQLATTLQSYDSLMEKLEVDISLVEKEKKKIVELMEDYLKEVHQNLGKIDHNSTIIIRNRPIKMLKIQVPAWEENENLYQMRLQDFIDEITKKGIELFEKNENAQEYFGTHITTKNLYDAVIGVGNIQIKLYKIEAQREYPITWAEVARNSGGEGFLSAFVILTSLMYYMRKDDTDIFADKNEGKVLIMDNPFAQTNASHLLKPLMEMAEKTNTQLICLSGLGGESIYNRFDNIYVLNLISASLRNGTEYLKGDHIRGDDPETMVVSQIEVMEQQELLF